MQLFEKLISIGKLIARQKCCVEPQFNTVARGNPQFGGVG